ncbi:MAG: UDP-glucose 4-epimerase GalE [Myxococcota bacterium]
MKVLVTGGAGYIGSHVLVELLLRGDEAIVFDSFERGHEDAVRRAERLGGGRVAVERGDLCDTGRVRDVLAAHEPDVVVHLAAYKSVGESIAHPERYERNNLQATRSLAAAMIESDCRRFVYASTGGVYGDAARPGAIDETAPLMPLSPYALTKAQGEAILSGAAEDHGFVGVNLRFFNVCGAHPSGELGEFADAPTNLLPVLMRQIVTSARPSVTVFGTDYATPDGSCIRDYIHICDIASGILAAVDATREGPPHRVYNLGTGRGCSVLQMVRAVEVAWGRNFVSHFGDRREGDPAVCVADPSRIARELGWRSRFALHDMVESTLGWTEQRHAVLA